MQRLGLVASTRRAHAGPPAFASAAGVDPVLAAWLMRGGQELLRALVLQHRLPVRLQVRRYGLARAAFGFDPGDIPASRVATRVDVAARIFRTDDVRVSVERGLIFFSVPLPPAFIDTIDPWALPPAGPTGVPLGLSEADTPITWRMDIDPHLLVVGPTGTGKSMILRLLLKALLVAPDTEFRFTVLGIKPQDWDAGLFFRQSWGFAGVDDAPAAVDWLLNEYHRRTRERIREPRIVIFIDDLLALLDKRHGCPDILPGLTTLFVQSRSAGFHLVAGLQASSGYETLPVIIKQMPRRVVTGAGSANEAYIAAGVAESGAQDLKRGEALSVGVTAGKRRATLIYVPRFEDSDLARLRGGVPDPAPWAVETGRNGGNGTKRNETAETGRAPLVFTPRSPVTAPPPAETDSGDRPVSPLDERVERVRAMVRERKRQGEIIETVWGAKPGGGAAYRSATEELREIMARLL